MMVSFLFNVFEVYMLKLHLETELWCQLYPENKWILWYINDSSIKLFKNIEAGASG